jgi:hypothetical protein
MSLEHFGATNTMCSIAASKRLGRLSVAEIAVQIGAVARGGNNRKASGEDVVRVGLVGLLAAGFAVAGTPASAQVRDAVYRGTIVCDKLPFTVGSGREAIEVTITGGAAQYTHVVRLHGAADPTPEKGAGTLSGSTISLQGSWKSGNRQYEAKYSGTFVRRHANLKGTQTWSDGGKSISRTCSGTIKRPLRVFLPRQKK